MFFKKKPNNKKKLRHSPIVPILSELRSITPPHIHRRRTLRMDKSGETTLGDSPYSPGWVWLESKQETDFRMVIASETVQKAGRYVILLDADSIDCESSLLFCPNKDEPPITFFKKTVGRVGFVYETLEERLWKLVERAEDHTAIMGFDATERARYNYDCEPYSMQRTVPNLGGCVIRHYLKADWVKNPYRG